MGLVLLWQCTQQILLILSVTKHLLECSLTNMTDTAQAVYYSVFID